MVLPPNLPAAVSNVPFYSQFHDIQSSIWQKKGCGITSLAMIIDFYAPKTVSVNKLLGQGIALGAYDDNAGWTYKGLIQVAEKHGFTGASYDLGGKSSSAAFDALKSYMKSGPVIVSVYYKFDPKSKIPHLVVINGVSDGTVYYNDPAAQSGEKQISVKDFEKGWKKRFIVIRPLGQKGAPARSSV